MYPGGQQYSGNDPEQWQQGGHVDPRYPQQPPPPYQQPVYQQQPPYQQQPLYQPPPNPQQPAYPGQIGYPPPPGYGYPPPVPPKSSQRSLFAIVAGVAVVAMLSVLGVAVYVLTAHHKPASGPTTAGGSTSPGIAQQSAPPPADGLTTGSGPVRVDVYVDYQCPPCSTFEAATADTLTNDVKANKITLRVHPVAFIDNRSKNQYSTRAAAAAECAFEGNRFLEFHQHLLSNQPAEDTAGPTDDELITAGRSLGLGQDFATCVTQKKRVSWVQSATTGAENYGVSSVPALYVNGKTVNATNSELVTAIAAG